MSTRISRAVDKPCRWVRRCAGEGFLSQSSKWLHFGIGPAATIQRVIVRWPDDSEPETFAGVGADGRFRLTQGRGVAARVDDRSPRVALSESVAKVPAPTAVARTVLAQRPQFPRLEYQDFQNQTRSLADAPAGPRLIVLWASWCQPCLTELSELAKQAAELRESGLAVVALATDSLDAESTEGMANARTLAEQLQAPFSFGWMSLANMDQLADVHREIIFRQRPLPIPCSFLIDSRGQLAVVYKGPVPGDQLMADLQLLNARPAEVELAAMPFPGRSLDTLRRAGPLQMAQAFREGGYWDDARAELNRLIEQVSTIDDLDALAAGIQQTLQPGAVHEWTRSPSPSAAPTKSQAPSATPFREGDANNSAASTPPSPLPDQATFKKLLLAEQQRMLVRAYLLLARTEHDAGATPRELDALQQVVKLQPDNTAARAEWIVALWQAGQRELARQQLERLNEQATEDAGKLAVVGQTWMKIGEPELAITNFQQAVSQDPDRIEPRLNLAMAQQLAHHPSAAIEHYSWILTRRPDSIDALNNLAWLYATYPRVEFRNGAKAEELGRQLCEMSRFQIPAFLDTFAAACAENGHFDEAVRVTELAANLARGRGEREQESVRHARLKLYQAGQPYREPGPVED